MIYKANTKKIEQQRRKIETRDEQMKMTTKTEYTKQVVLGEKETNNCLFSSIEFTLEAIRTCFLQ